MQKQKEMYTKRWIIFLSIGISIFMSTLDGSIVNVALPVISKQLNVPMSTVQWTITIYLIAITGVLLPSGRLGDLKGKIKIYKIGVIIFTFGSLFCGISPNVQVLIAARIIQGLGAALTMANSVGIIISIFPLTQKGKILGIASLIASLGNMLGPALGGIISNYRWEYIFFINVPLGIISLIISFKVMPNIKPEATKKIKLDFIGTILFILSIVPFIVSITEGSIYGFINPKIIYTFIISIASFTLFIFSQLKLKTPLINFEIFKNSQFTKGIITSFLMFTAINSNLILMPFYFEKVRRISPLYSGIFMMSFPVAMTITGPVSGYISDKIKKEILPLIGLLSLTSGFICMTNLRSNTPIYLVLIYLSLIGIGSGIFQAPMNSIIMSTVHKNKLGISSSLCSLGRNLGMIIGITLGTTLLYKLMSHKLGFKVNGFITGKDISFVSSMQDVFKVATIICIIAIIIIISIINSNKKLKKLFKIYKINTKIKELIIIVYNRRSR